MDDALVGELVVLDCRVVSLPNPTIPTFLLLAFVPIICVGRHPLHCLARTSRSPSPARRATINISVIAMSAVHSLRTSGVFVTVMPAACAAEISICENPTP